MKDVLDKISSYNIFSNLLPGILLVILLKKYVGYDMVQENDFLGAFLYYFIGMVVSRFGSLTIEPLLKFFKFVMFEPYKNYLIACGKDSKIETLSEINNTFRTIISLLVLIFLIKLYSKIEQAWNISENVSYGVLITLLVILFLLPQLCLECSNNKITAILSLQPQAILRMFK